MARKRRDRKVSTPLSLWLQKLMKEQKLSVRDLSLIAGVPSSTIYGWVDGAIPSEPALLFAVQRLANRWGVSLGLALTGASDAIELLAEAERALLFEGLVEIRVTKVYSKNSSVLEVKPALKS
ncbi:MAG: hypothetical protein JNL01_03155 [Bdellovibrionales bacterium]|nr:hypothetical protein [Bdellovibrionales bacterium]